MLSLSLSHACFGMKFSFLFLFDVLWLCCAGCVLVVWVWSLLEEVAEAFAEAS